MNGMVFSSTIGSTPWSDGLHDMSHFLTVQLEPIANQLNQLGIPEPIQHWGHPFFMSIVIFAMGSAVAITGWKGRLLLTSNETASIDNRSQHRKIAPWMFLFLSMIEFIDPVMFKSPGTVRLPVRLPVRFFIFS